MPNTSQLSQAVHLLTVILQQRQNHGNEGIVLSEQQLDMLHKLPQHIRQLSAPRLTSPQSTGIAASTQTPAAPSSPSHLAPIASASPPGPNPGNANPSASPTFPSSNAPDSHQTQKTKQRPALDQHRPVESHNSDELERRNKLNDLYKKVKSDPRCRALGSLRETVVFACGNTNARLMLIGEAPGAEEERLKEPFVGPAGQLLDKILQGMGFKREDVYISNIVKFRPQVGGSQNQGNGNRKPNQEEIKACLKYIMAEIDVVQPDVIVALGGTAANALLGGNTPVGKLRMQSHSLKGIPLVVTYHPSYLLHCETSSPGKLNAEKRKVWNDMKSAMKTLEVPPSSHQS